MDLIYLDHNSTTPVLPAVVEAMRPFWSDNFANPASAHQAGRRARQALELAREQVATFLDAAPQEVIFTSGATEANNLGVLGCAGDEPFRVLASPIEHPSVAEPLDELERRGFDVKLLPVDQTGVIRAEALPSLLSEKVGLVTVMLANNETGVVQPVERLVQETKTGFCNPAFHCDAVQAVGKMPVSFHGLKLASLSLSAHKFGGPRGVGALLVRRRPKPWLKPLFLGGHQQQGLRPGTEPVALAVGLAKALEIACSEMIERRKHVTLLRDRFLERLHAGAAPTVVNGPLDGSPYTSNVSFPGCRAETLLIKLDLVGVACSTGSACSSGSLLPSPVLKAMGCPPDVLQSAMRFSFSHLLTVEDINEASARIGRAVRELRLHGD